MILGKEADTYLKNVIKSYEQNSSDSRYDHVLLPSYNQRDQPNIFIWCPITHFGLTMKCPVHGTNLKPGMDEWVAVEVL